MEGLQPWCSAALPIIARCCKSCSWEKSPFLSCCWWGHCTPFTSAMAWPWLRGDQCNSCSPSDTRSPCVFLAAHVLCLLISLLHEELRGRPRAFFLKLPREQTPGISISALHLSLHSVVWFEVSVWRMVLLSTSDSDWSCAVLVGDTSRADGSAADLLSGENREHCWGYLQGKACAPWRGLQKSWGHYGRQSRCTPGTAKTLQVKQNHSMFCCHSMPF